jgi:hypothetical protein
VASAAYRARCEITDERTGLTHDYSRHGSKCLFEGIYAPKDGPDWTRDRAQLWNHVEAFEKHRAAQLAREFEIALPHELTLEQSRYAVQDWVRENFTRRGLIADVAIHAPGQEGDYRNVHAHVMVVMRKLDGSEFAARKERHETFAERKAELEALRESWERIGNRHLERHGFEGTLDRRTLEAQGIDREAGVHLGKAAMDMERRGMPTERGDLNREAANENDRPRQSAASNDRDLSRAIYELSRTDPTLARIIVAAPDREAVWIDLRAGVQELRQEGREIRHERREADAARRLDELAQAGRAEAERARDGQAPIMPSDLGDDARKRVQEALRRAAGASQPAKAPEAAHGPENAPPVVFQLSASVQLRGQAQTVSLTPGRERTPGLAPAAPAPIRARPEAEILPPLRPPPVTTPAHEGPVIDAEQGRDVSLLRRAVDLAKAALAAIGERLEQAFAKVREAFSQDRPPERPRPEPEAAALPRPPEPLPERPRLLRDRLAEIQREIDAERAAETPQQRAERENLDRLRRELSRSGGRTREPGL